MSVTKVCEVCGNQFSVIDSRAEKAKTCSKACKYEAAKRIAKENMAKDSCLWCGADVFVPVSHAKRGQGKFCSRKCQTLYLTGVKLGTRSFDGDISLPASGYVLERKIDHPYANNRGYVLQHRLRIEERMRKVCSEHQFLVEHGGVKYLSPDVCVHHKNEIKDDNRIENLVACTVPAHKDIHAGKTPMVGETWPEVDGSSEYESRMQVLTCAKCGSEFAAKLSNAKQGRKYCSRVCYDASKYEGDLPKFVVRNCLVCGIEFSAKRDRVLVGHGKYCSNECRHKARVGRPPSHIEDYKQ